MWEKWTSIFIFREYLKITPKFWWLCWRTFGHTCVPCSTITFIDLNFFFFCWIKKIQSNHFFLWGYIYIYIYSETTASRKLTPFMVVVYSWKRTPEDKIVTHEMAFIYECMIFQSCMYQKIWQYVQVHISKECIHCSAYLRFCCVNEGCFTKSFIFL